MEEEQKKDEPTSWMASLIAVGLIAYSYTLEMVILQALGGFVSLVWLASFIGDFKLNAGLSTSHLVGPSTRTISFLLAYGTVIATLWLVYPIWAATLTPWIIKSTMTHILSALVEWEILDIRDADDEDE